jgi:hypothetical protein
MQVFNVTTAAAPWRGGNHRLAARGCGRPCCHDCQVHDDLQPVTRRARLWAAAEARNVPLRAILATVAVVVAVWMAGKLIYRLRDVLLLMIVAGFLAMLLNP